MKFEPISSIPYARFNPDAQLLVCTNMEAPETARAVWGERAAAAFDWAWDDPIDELLRDILANPQIRAIVFVEAKEPGPSVLRAFWHGAREDGKSGISALHLDLVRRFVDLFDHDCGIYGPLQPFWPERIKYGSPESARGAAAQDGGGNARGADAG